MFVRVNRGPGRQRTRGLIKTGRREKKKLIKTGRREKKKLIKTGRREKKKGEEEATWRADQHARVHVGHLRRAVHERGEALNVLLLLRDVALVLQDLQAMCQKHCTPPQPLLQCP
jgi:hypothetical protein